MTGNFDIRRPYNPNLYIERTEEHQKAQKWLAGNKRLLTVTASPATGKTWFLHRLQQAFSEDNVITFWIDVKALMASEEQRFIPKINPEKTQIWLQQFIQDVQDKCQHTKRFEANINVSVTIELLAKALVNECWSPDCPICIFIDEGDEIKENGWQEFEDQIIGPFAEQEQLRFVISLRGDQRISTFPLRFSEQRLPLKTWLPNADGLHEGYQQFAALKEAFPNSTTTLEQILATLPGYQQNHPGLNTFIYLFAQSDTSPQQLQDIDSLAGVIAALNPQSSDNPQLLSRLLLGIMGFSKDEWVIEELASWLGVSNTVAWEYVGLLRTNWLVVNVTHNRHKITDGVREFVQAILHISSSGKEATDVNQLQRNRVLSLMLKYFSLDDIRKIAFNLGINYDELGGDKLSIKAMELIEYSERRGNFLGLIAECQLQAPHIVWQL